MNLIKKILIPLSTGFTMLVTIGSFLLPEETKSLVSHIPHIYSIIILIILAAGGILCICITFKSPNKEHKLKFGSTKYIDFFEHWYLQNGKISIVCDDLDWTIFGSETAIYNVLQKKAKEGDLSLYLKEKNNKIVDDLRKLGAKVYSRPDAISNYGFSVIEVMGNKTNNIIVRDKRKDNGKNIMFEEKKGDPFLPVLLETTIELEEKIIELEEKNTQT